MSARWLTTADAAAWEDELPAARSAFGSVGFARVQETAGLGESRLLVVERDGARVAYPILLRPLAELPFDLPAGIDGARWDTGTPPYTGPLPTAGDDPAALAADVASALAEEGVVSEFAHLDPWHAAPVLAGGGEPDREIVWVDVTRGDAELWRESYSHSCRKNVSRAEREGVSVRAAQSERDLEEFHRIYTATMERNRALDAYMLPLAYFRAVASEMAGSSRFVLAEHEGRVIAATLYLHDEENAYSYLGGADHEFQRLRPTNAVVHETIRWARERGCRRLVLGGGYRPDDGIMRFKSSFSPLRARLELARRVHRPEAYELLAEAWRAHHSHDGSGVGYFPFYRAPAP